MYMHYHQRARILRVSAAIELNETHSNARYTKAERERMTSGVIYHVMRSRLAHFNRLFSDGTESMLSKMRGRRNRKFYYPRGGRFLVRCYDCGRFVPVSETLAVSETTGMILASGRHTSNDNRVCGLCEQFFAKA